MCKMKLFIISICTGFTTMRNLSLFIMIYLSKKMETDLKHNDLEE